MLEDIWNNKEASKMVFMLWLCYYAKYMWNIVSRLLHYSFIFDNKPSSITSTHSLVVTSVGVFIFSHLVMSLCPSNLSQLCLIRKLLSGDWIITSSMAKLLKLCLQQDPFNYSFKWPYYIFHQHHKRVGKTTLKYHSVCTCNNKTN